MRTLYPNALILFFLKKMLQAFPQITYVRGASGKLVPVLCGTRLRVQTIVIAAQKWGLSANQIAAEYDLNEAQVNEVLAFYAAHSQEIDASIAAEQIIEADNSSAIFPLGVG
jgi:uncharacterized protein (DUF433 family)